MVRLTMTLHRSFQFKSLLAISAALLLVACAGTPTGDRAPVLEGSTRAEGAPTREPEPPVVTTYKYRSPSMREEAGDAASGSSSPAVNSLLSRAENAGREQDWDSAAASLERALRIEPRNPVLWNRLAEARLQQGQYNQAVQLASKSNSLSGQDRLLQARNWRLIARAKRSLGDDAGAREAERRAEALR